MRFYHWLVSLGLYKDLLSASIAYSVAHMLAVRPIKRLLRQRNNQNETLIRMLGDSRQAPNGDGPEATLD